LTIKQVALGACLLISGTTLAQDRTYTVKQGDTLSEIASKFGVNSKSILDANRLQSADKLKLGQSLRIPSTAPSPKYSSLSHTNDVRGYSVQPGDNDERIAKKLGTTAKQLRLANLGIKWNRLQIGQKLNRPTTKGWFETMANKAINSPTQEIVAKVQAPKSEPVAKLISTKSTVVGRTHSVQEGENDWIIAKHVGIKTSQLRAMNPNVNWTKLQIGTVLHIPGQVVKSNSGVVLASKVDRDPNIPRIRSRYAVVTGDDVTLRTGPSTRFETFAQVDQGTRVLVLDRQGAWYKARFPKGSEAWVRGDFLAPTKAPQLLAMNKPAKTKPSQKKKHEVLVAAKASRPSRLSRNQGSIARRPVRDNGSPLVTASGAGDNIIDKARSYLGVRYRYGASSRSATDCSGFTTQVFRSMGVKLPRTAREQSGRGQRVAMGELQAGDLVFFNTRGSRVSHVGIYKGNGVFIHASSGRGHVMESKLTEGYYQRRFAGARRVIASKGHKTTKVAHNDAPKSEPVEPTSTPVEPKVAAPPDAGGN